MGIIEDYFHTIINPKILGPDKFYTVICLYTRAYLKIVEDILGLTEIKDKNTYLSILNDPKDNYKKIVEKIKSFNQVSYYSIIESCNKKENINIITSNYTPICEMKTGLKNIAYFHGKLNLFESPYEMKVYDITNDDDASELSNIYYFPYIFIQSALKPIVEKKQIIEYSKAINFLEESKCLIIIGYKINCDDNHINNIIRDFLLKHKVIYFDYDNIGENIILNKLRYDKCDNFEYISINKENCINF